MAVQGYFLSTHHHDSGVGQHIGTPPLEAINVVQGGVDLPLEAGCLSIIVPVLPNPCLGGFRSEKGLPYFLAGQVLALKLVQLLPDVLELLDVVVFVDDLAIERGFF